MKQGVQFSTALHMLFHILHADGPVISTMLDHCASANPVVIRRTIETLRERASSRQPECEVRGWHLIRPADQVFMRDVYMSVAGDSMFSFHARDTNSGYRVVGVVDTLLGENQREMEVLYLSRLAGI